MLPYSFSKKAFKLPNNDITFIVKLYITQLCGSFWKLNVISTIQVVVNLTVVNITIVSKRQRQPEFYLLVM